MTTESATTIVYPETDGMPLPDGEYQAPIYVSVVGTLRTFFSDVPGARVNGDTFIYYVEGDPRRVFSPDCYVAFGLSEAALESLSMERNNTYLLWEVGKPPDFILEIGSPSTGAVDTGRKRDLYAEIGVGEYWRYDPSGGDFYGEPLVGERLVDGEYERFELRHQDDGSVRSHSEALNLELQWIDGELRFWDPVKGERLLNQQEEHDERVRAQARADDAEARANAAEARASRLEAELRRMRGK